MRVKMLTITLLCFLSVITCSTNAAKNDSSNNLTASAPIIEGKFSPLQGKTLLFIGQDSDTIEQYIHAMPEDSLEGVTLYTQLKSTDPASTLQAVFKSADWDSGNVDFAKTLSQAPNAHLAIGLAFDQCNQTEHASMIASGSYDRSLSVFIDYLKSLAPRKIFLRIGYEFDGPWNCYKPSDYKNAFRHIALGLRAADAKNVATVWQTATWPDPTIAGDDIALYDHRLKTHLENWYPGDDVVDWISFSAFYADLSQWNFVPVDTPAAAQNKLLNFARLHKKPVFIAEAAPQAYRIEAQTRSFIGLNSQTPFSAEAIWQEWYAPFFRLIHDNSDVIRAVAYINAHWDSQEMWKCAEGSSPPKPDCMNGNWGDSRVQAHPYIKRKWLSEVTDDQRWVQSIETQR